MYDYYSMFVESIKRDILLSRTVAGEEDVEEDDSTMYTMIMVRRNARSRDIYIIFSHFLI